MKLKTLLNEAPLADISYRQSGKGAGSFKKREKELIQRYISKKTYHERLKKIPFNLYVYIIDDTGLRDIGKEYPDGEITNADLKKKIYTTSQTEIDLSHPRFDSVFDDIAKNKKKDKSGVHFIIGDNYSEKNQINLTAWMLIHRFSHTFVNGGLGVDMPDFLDTYYGKAKVNKMINMFFTFKSAEAKKVENYIEMFAELAAQYYITGDIPIKSVDHKYEEDRIKVVKFIEDLKKKLDNQVKTLQGKILYI